MVVVVVVLRFVRFKSSYNRVKCVMGWMIFYVFILSFRAFVFFFFGLPPLSLSFSLFFSHPSATEEKLKK